MSWILWYSTHAAMRRKYYENLTTDKVDALLEDLSVKNERTTYMK